MLLNIVTHDFYILVCPAEGIIKFREVCTFGIAEKKNHNSIILN
jgi:hypothetical protein